MDLLKIKKNIWIVMILFIIAMIFFLIGGLYLLSLYFNTTNPVFFLLEIPWLLLMLEVLRKIVKK